MDYFQAKDKKIIKLNFLFELCAWFWWEIIWVLWTRPVIRKRKIVVNRGTHEGKNLIIWSLILEFHYPRITATSSAATSIFSHLYVAHTVSFAVCLLYISFTIPSFMQKFHCENKFLSSISFRSLESYPNIN